MSIPPKKRSFGPWILKASLLAMIGAIIASISIPNLLRSRVAANEASAIGSLRTINSAAASYRAQHSEQGYPQNLPDLAPYLDPSLAAGLKSGYRFRYEPTTMDLDGSVSGFRVEAIPVRAGESGQRTFSSSDSGDINYRATPQSAEKPLLGAPSSKAHPPAEEPRRIVRKASMTMVVSDPAAASEEIRAVADRLGGFVESARLSDEESGTHRASMIIRVPITRLGEARRQIRALANHVSNEEDDARDVTRQYVDLASTLQNYGAEEAQYREIMRRSGSIKDTLAVAERLADVRGRIERAQGQLNLMSRQTETAALEITLSTVDIAKPVDVRWHLHAQIASAFSDSLHDLAAFANVWIAVLFRIPVYLLWALTVTTLASFSWRLLRWFWKKLIPSPAATT